ncbi:MAG: hypothetical protein H6R13_3019 [Proteobacteria bacterium]|nr:hypothetical protein [Pseudomonadota bacterium]
MDAQYRRLKGKQKGTFTIKQDAQGRYCLNDLHKASGGNKKHAPNEFLRLDGTKELVAELTGDSRFDPVQSIRGGSAPGVNRHHHRYRLSLHQHTLCSFH